MEASDLNELKRLNFIRLLKEKRLKQIDLSRQIGKSPGHISDIIKGRKSFGKEFEAKLIEKYGLPYQYFMKSPPGIQEQINYVKEPGIQYETEIDRLIQKTMKIMRSGNEFAIQTLKNQIGFLYKNIKKSK